MFFRLHALKPQDLILQVYKPQESSDQSSVMGWVHCLLMNPFEPCHAKTGLMHTKCKVVKIVNTGIQIEVRVVECTLQTHYGEGSEKMTHYSIFKYGAGSEKNEHHILGPNRCRNVC